MGCDLVDYRKWDMMLYVLQQQKGSWQVVIAGVMRYGGTGEMDGMR